MLIYKCCWNVVKNWYGLSDHGTLNLAASQDEIDKEN